MFIFLYQITNLLNNKIYIGIHRTDNVNDDYMGSGKRLQIAIKKYGIENFKKEILEYFNTYEEALIKEKEIVNKEFLNRNDVYNLAEGGYGGFEYINRKKLSIRNITKENSKFLASLGNKKIKERKDKDPTWWNDKNKRISNKLKGHPGWFLGKNHTQETKNKQSQSMKGKNLGNKNGQFGTCWIFNINLKQNKQIDKNLLLDYINNGWIKGRRFKF